MANRRKDIHKPTKKGYIRLRRDGVAKMEHVTVWVNYDGKEECIECFYAWEKALTLQDDGFYKQTPWKYKKCLISVDRYLKCGEHAGRLDEAFITKIG